MQSCAVGIWEREITVNCRMSGKAIKLKHQMKMWYFQAFPLQGLFLYNFNKDCKQRWKNAENAFVEKKKSAEKANAEKKIILKILIVSLFFALESHTGKKKKKLTIPHKFKTNCSIS